MTTLLMRLAGPMQAWGDSSRFAHRQTRHEPTKSGVLGLLAAAQGRRRTDPIEDLAQLRFGVRVDQRGSLIRDFQTAHHLISGKPMPLTYRYYLSDAVFVAAVEGDRALLEGLHDALRSPAFPLYLGRRSCPPAAPVALGLQESDLVTALGETPWLASARHRRESPRTVMLRTVVDAAAADAVVETVRDVPISFSQERREYGWREIAETSVMVTNPEGSATASEFFATVEGA